MGLINLANKNTMLELQYAIGKGTAGIPVAEVLTQHNPILEDAPWFPANSGFKNVVIQRSSLGGAIQKRQFNAGVKPTSTGKLQYDDPSAMVEDYSEVDKALADASGPAYRQGEDGAKIENMSQGWADLLFYDKPTPTQLMSIHGFAERAKEIDNDVCLSAGGATNLSSIYVVHWGIQGAYLFYPTGQVNKGVHHQDLGQKTKEASDGSMHEVMRSNFHIYGGLSLVDGRCLKRVSNIDVTDEDSFVNYENLLIKLLNKIPNTAGKTVIYCNTDVQTMFDIRAKDKVNVMYGPDNVWGKPQLMFKGVPIKVCDAIKSDETLVA